MLFECVVAPMRFALLVTFVVVAALAQADGDLPYGFFKAPKFTLNLDAPPEQRWEGAIELIVAAHGWDNTFGNILDHYRSMLNELPTIVCDVFSENVQKKFPDRAGELTYLAKRMIAVGNENNYDFGNFTAPCYAFFSYFYEFGDLPNLQSSTPRQRDKSCTGILSLPADTRLPMIHGRNMDESPLDGRNVTLDITVTRGGKTIYNIFDWTWFTAGAFTASSANVTLEENWRNHTFLTVEEIVIRILTPGTIPISFMFRHILESNFNFEQAVEFLNTTQVAAPFYVIASGPGRVGAIVTGSFNATDNVVEFLNDNSSVTFKVQTNYDRWLPDPMYDPRRTVAEQHLAMLGRNRSGTELGVWMTASTYPVHNAHTMYTVLMNVETPPEGYIRVPMHPLPGYRS